jgi:hypothetical protein
MQDMLWKDHWNPNMVTNLWTLKGSQHPQGWEKPWCKRYLRLCWLRQGQHTTINFWGIATLPAPSYLEAPWKARRSRPLDAEWLRLRQGREEMPEAGTALQFPSINIHSRQTYFQFKVTTFWRTRASVKDHPRCLADARDLEQCHAA